MENIILSPIRLTDLQLMIHESVIAALNEKDRSVKPAHPHVEAANDIKLSIPELAMYLKCSLPTIHKYKKDGVIPFYRLGRKVYFKKSEIDASAIVTTKSMQSRLKRAR